METVGWYSASSAVLQSVRKFSDPPLSSEETHIVLYSSRNVAISCVFSYLLSFIEFIEHSKVGHLQDTVYKAGKECQYCRSRSEAEFSAVNGVCVSDVGGGICARI